MISEKRESVSRLRRMKIDEQWERLTLGATENEGT